MKLRKEIIQLAFCSITLLGIVHFLTRPKVYTDTEYITVTDIEYIDREVEKIVEIPITVTDTVYEYIDADGLTFDIVFKMYRKALGPNKKFYWRGGLYNTKWREEIEENTN